MRKQIVYNFMRNVLRLTEGKRYIIYIIGAYVISENYVLVEHWLLLDICHLVIKLIKKLQRNVHYSHWAILEAQH